MTTRADAGNANTRLLGPLLTAFAASGAIMIIELTAGRLISRYLGMSLYTWTSVIAVMMAGMSTGNALGGYVADRYAPRRALGVLFLLAAAACVALLPLNSLMGSLGALRAMAWPERIFLHVLGLFFLPAVALGGIAPVVARLALSLGGPQGRTVGLVYASSVAGSIVCTFLTGYYLVLLIGVTAILCVSAAMLAALGVLYLLWGIASSDPAPTPPNSHTTASDGVGPWWPAIATVMLSNFAFMSIELGAARVLSRDYGNSVFTWTATIGVFLSGITLGNAMGGWVADHRSDRRTVAKYFLAASIATLAGPFLYRLIHESFQGGTLSLGWGARIAVVLAAGFFLPCFFIGYISPLIVKRGLDSGRAPGRTVASVYAWGAVGAVLGTLASGYYLIDWLGSLGVVCCSGVLLALGAALYAGTRPLHLAWLAASIAVAFCALSTNSLAVKMGDALRVRPRHYGNVVYQDESQYSFIAIKAEPDNERMRTMILDKLDHSRIDLDHPEALKQEYEWIYQAVLGQVFPGTSLRRAFFMGGGGFTFVRQFDAECADCRVEVAEIDPAVTEAAHAAFGFARNDHIAIWNMDARNRITTLADQQQASNVPPPFQLIVGDSFNDLSVPSHLTTLEYTRIVKSLLSDDGIYMLNMIDMYNPGLFLSAFVKTLREVFPYVYVFNSGRPPSVRDTFVIVCSNVPRDLRGVPDAVRAHNPYGGHLLETAAVDQLLARTQARVLTDDYAPTELQLMPVVLHGNSGFGQEHFGNALQAASAGNIDAALQECALAIDGHPGWPDAYELAADLLTRKQQFDPAQQALQHALEFAPEPSRLHAKLGGVLLAKGDLAGGKKELLAALAANPDLLDAMFQLTGVLFTEQRFDEAVTVMSHAIEVAPANVVARYNLGLAHSLKGDKSAAAAQWEIGLQTEPANMDCLDGLLQAYLDLKDYDKAFGVAARYRALGKEPPAAKLEQLHRDSGRTE